MADSRQPTIHAASAIVACASLMCALPANAMGVDIHGPPGSVEFGRHVFALPNGNFVVSDPRHSDGGAVHLYSPVGELISTLTAAGNADPTVVTVLSNGHFVVCNPLWENEAGARVGAAAWVDANTGLSGPISPANALVGSQNFDYVCNRGVTALSNGNYLVRSRDWRNGNIQRAGAITWGSGVGGKTGMVSPANSLVGAHDLASIGDRVTALRNGNFVVESMTEDGVPLITWADGTKAAAGTPSTANSFYGTPFGSLSRVLELSDGNFVVSFPNWNDGVGAVTWMDGGAGLVGPLSALTSIVGRSPGDNVGSGGVTALKDGKYVISSPRWDADRLSNVGAVTLVRSPSERVGVVAPSNSLIGTSESDQIGEISSASGGITALTNGNFVVASPAWGADYREDVGAVTWVSATSGLTGQISISNSLLGVLPGDAVGNAGITALANGNYVVGSIRWKNASGLVVGAATWRSGYGPTSGTITGQNSVTGSKLADAVGRAVIALRNGNYVLVSPFWDRGSIQDAGAITWLNGAHSSAGIVSTSNSLVGGQPNAGTGMWATPLSSGDYVVSSNRWSSTGNEYLGAVTWGSGIASTTGQISSANSLTGVLHTDSISSGGVTAFSSNQYAVSSPSWSNGPLSDAGAVTFASGPVVGHVNESNSVVGTVEHAGQQGGYAGLVLAYDAPRRRFLIGRRASNVVTIASLFPDTLFGHSFETE